VHVAKLAFKPLSQFISQQCSIGEQAKSQN
jgi:hypothetical protein